MLGISFKIDRISDMEGGFISWCRFERLRSEGTAKKNLDGIAVFRRIIGDIPIQSVKLEHFDEVRKALFERGLSRSRVATVIYSMKSLLRYCRDIKGFKIPFLDKIKAPAQERNRIVKTLSKEEIRRSVEAIHTMNVWTGKKKKHSVNLHRLRWKCLLEVLWSSGMRISEALSLNRDRIDWQRREATIIGKGNKPRRVFFSEEAMRLLQEYLKARHDTDEALFVSHCQARRWSFSAAQNYLERWRMTAGLSEHVTFHTFRRSFASFIFYEKDIYAASKLLGHADLETTRRHYISEDWEKLRSIHRSAIDSHG